MRVFSLSLLCLLMLLGCLDKQIVYQRVNVPVKCNLKMPNKPKAGDDFASHKALMGYFLDLESIAKACLKGENDE